MSRTNGNNHDFVSVSVDGSQEEQGNHKAFRYLLNQNNPTVYLTATSNSEDNPVHTNDGEEDDLLTWNLITADDEENDEKNPIDPDKQSSSAAAKIDTALSSPIAALPIVIITASVLPSDKDHFSFVINLCT